MACWVVVGSAVAANVLATMYLVVKLLVVHRRVEELELDVQWVTSEEVEA